MNFNERILFNIVKIDKNTNFTYLNDGNRIISCGKVENLVYNLKLLVNDSHRPP